MVPAQNKQRNRLLLLLYFLLALAVAFSLTFGYLVLQPYISGYLSSLSRNIQTAWEDLTTPKPTYTFKKAPGKTGFALINENKAGGFKVLLGKTNSPKTPQARFEVADSWLDMSLATNVGESAYKKLSFSEKLSFDQQTNKDLVKWENVLPNTDITYQMKADGLKEDIILKDKTLAQKAVDEHELFTLPFYLTTYNVVPRYDLNGKMTPIFMDSKTGEYRFHLETPYLADAKGARYESVEFELKPLDVAMENTTKKSAFADFGDSTEVGSNLAYHLVPSITQSFNTVKSGVEVTGFAPAESWMISQIPYSSTPTPNSSYHKNLSMDSGSDLESIKGLTLIEPARAAEPTTHNLQPTTGSRYLLVLKLPREWLADPSRAYPVIIDPTITHNTQTAFATGTLNRVKDEGAADAAPLLTSSYHELPADINTVGLWHMNEASGLSVADSSGNANTGTATGTTVVAGRLGNARSFNGTSDYVSINDSASLKITGDLTIEAWINSPLSARSEIVFKHYNNEYDFGLEPGGGFNFWHGDGVWEGVAGVASGSIPSNTWTHVAAVRTMSDKKVRFYANGVYKGEWAFTKTPVASTNPVLIGARGPANQMFTGQIDDLRISNTARTPEEIKANAQRHPYSVYTSPVMDLTVANSWTDLTWLAKGVRTGDGETPISTSGLVAQWNFNETSGTAAVSGGSCGTSCNGTLAAGFASTTSQDQSAGTGWTANNKRWGAGALMFDGGNDTISISPINTITNQLTVEAWVKPSSVTTIGATVSNWDSPSTNAFVLFSDYISSKPRFRVGPGGVDKNADAKTALVAGNWYHLTGIYDGTNAYIYVNGVQEGSIAATGNLLTTNDDMDIGSYGGSNFFQGTIDSVRIYSRALTAAEILANYQAGNIELQTRTSADNATWQEWRPVTSETAITAMDSDSANWLWDMRRNAANTAWEEGATAAYMPKSKTDDATTKIEGAGSLKTTIGAPQVDASTVGLWHLDETSGTGAYIKSATSPVATTTTYNYTGGNQTFTVPGDVSSITVKTWGGGGGGVGYDTSGAGGGSAYATSTLSVTPGEAITVDVGGGGGAGTGCVSNSGAGGGGGGGYGTGGAGGNTGVAGCSAGGGGGGAGSFVRRSSTVLIAAGGGGGGGGAESGSAGAGGGGGVNGAAGSCSSVGGTAGGSGSVNGSAGTQPGWDASAGGGGGGGYNGGTGGGAPTCDATGGAGGGGGNSLGTTVNNGSGTTPGNSADADRGTAGNGGSGAVGTAGKTIISYTTANPATPTGTTVVDGFYGKGRQFNGTSDRIALSNGSQVNVTGDISVETWINPASFAASSSPIHKDSQYSFQIDTSGNVSWADSSNWNYGAFVATNIGLVTNQWQHLAFTKTGGVVKIYLNGVEKALKNFGGALSSTTNVLHIGCYANATTCTSAYFNGKLDEVRISNTARSAEEIAEAYRAGRDHRVTRGFVATDLSAKTKLPFYVAADRPGTYLEAAIGEGAFANYEPDANTVGLWHLDEQSGSGAYLKDSSSNGNNGTPTSNTVSTATYGYTGGSQTYTVPAGISSITVKTWGGGGGSTNYGPSTTGGGGAYSTSTISVTPGEALTVDVGGGGGVGTGCVSNGGAGGGGGGGYGTGGAGGNTGVAGCSTGGGGGGAGSFVRRSLTVLIAAGGGGGSGGSESGGPGAGGGGGVNGSVGSCSSVGGTAGGSGSVNGSAGTQPGWDASAGGGGGGGYNGGTGGGAPTCDAQGGAGGGGGNSLGTTVNNGSGATPGNSADADRGTAGNGGSGVAGTAGTVKIYAYTAPSSVQGKIGKARSFNGSSDYISVPSSTNWNFAGDFTVDTWYKATTRVNYPGLVSTLAYNGSSYAGWTLGVNYISASVQEARFRYFTAGEPGVINIYGTSDLNDGNWHHVAVSRSGSTISLFVDSRLESSATSAVTITGVGALTIGRLWNDLNSGLINGIVDEARVSNASRTADQIRQAFEIGKRTHPITIDFVSSPQAAYTTGTSVTINNPYGTTALTSTLSVGDTIIFKENVNGTETVSQAVVTAITNTSSTYGTVTLASAPTFPTGGYSTNAKVFKWQREYFDLTGSLPTHRDGSTRLTLRITDGSQGANVWLDDFRSNTNYISLNTPTSFDTATGIGTYTVAGTSIPSTLNRYFQYRSILSSWDTPVSPQLTSASLNYTSNNTPTAPAISAPANAATQVSLTPVITLSSTDADLDYIRYKIQIATDAAFSAGLQTFDQTVSQTGWSGQNTQTSTAYTSGSTATYTVQTPLSGATTYYIRAYGVDPAGSNLWGSASATISFTTNSAPNAPAISAPINAATGVSVTPAISLAATDAYGDYVRYKVQLATDAAFSTGLQTFDQTVSQTGWSGQNTQTSTAYTSGTTGTYTLQSALTAATTYYLRAYATDPGGANLWSSASSTISFTTNSYPATPTYDVNYLFDKAKTSSTPYFIFKSSDPDGNTVKYEIDIDDDPNFGSPLIRTSDAHAGFANNENPPNTSPFTQNQFIKFTVQTADALTNGTTYYWKVRASDQSSASSWSSFTAARSFTVDTSLTKTMWFETTSTQFATDTFPANLLNSGDKVTMVSNLSTLQNADTVSQWVASPPLLASQDTVDKQEGTGSVKSIMKNDGALSVASGTTTINTVASGGVTGTAGATTLTMTSTTGLTAGDEIMISQTTGTGAGNYETRYITVVNSGTQVTLSSALTNSYVSGAQALKIPLYTSVSISAGATLTASAWNGTTGGILFFRSTGTVTNSGTITMSGKGFAAGSGAGGGGGGAGQYTTGSDGSAYHPYGPSGGGGGGGQRSDGSGGGGGAGGIAGGNQGGTGGSGGGGGGGGAYGASTSGGGGGSYAGCGGNNCLYSSSPGGGGAAGASRGDATLATIALGMGGGGGGGGAGGAGGNSWAGGCDPNNPSYWARGGDGGGGGTGGAGGTGGGIIFISTSTLTNSGTITSNGTNAGSGSGAGGGGGGGSECFDYNGGSGGGGGGGGAGGSGGAVYLQSSTVTIGTVTATAGSAGGGGGGGPAGNGKNGSGVAGVGGGSGSAGSVGRIRCDNSAGNCTATTPVAYSAVNTSSVSTLNATITYTHPTSVNLADAAQVAFWVKSDTTGSYRFQMGESASTEQTFDYTITAANTWEQKTWDISAIPNTSKDATKYLAFKFTQSLSSVNFWFDHLQASGKTETIRSSAIAASTVYPPGDTWGPLSFSANSNGGSVKYQVYYDNVGTPTIIPDSALPGNAAGFSVSPVLLNGLSAAAYPVIYLSANIFWASGLSPELLDWGMKLDKKPTVPVISAPANAATGVSLTPVITLSSTDAESDFIRYKIQLATDAAFSTGLQTFDQSVSQTGWSGQNTQTSTAYTSGTTATYTVQTALAANTLYYLRAYAVDPAGSNVSSSASSTISFTSLCDTCRMQFEGVKIDGIQIK